MKSLILLIVCVATSYGVAENDYEFEKKSQHVRVFDIDQVYDDSLSNPVFFEMPATTPKSLTTRKVTTRATKKPATTKRVKPTGNPAECKMKLKACIKRTPRRHRYRCVIHYKKCLWKLCPVRKCFVNLHKCMHKARSLKDKFQCARKWKKCMHSHKCPRYTYDF